MRKIKRKLRDICREVGVPHLQVTEVLRRVDQAVREDQEVITQEVGTFYLRKSKARAYIYQGVSYAVPERVSVALRGKRFQGRELSGRVAIQWFVSNEDDPFISHEFDLPLTERFFDSTTGEITVDSGGGVEFRIRFEQVRTSVTESNIGPEGGLIGIFVNSTWQISSTASSDPESVAYREIETQSDRPRRGPARTISGVGMNRPIQSNGTNDVFFELFRVFGQSNEPIFSVFGRIHFLTQQVEDGIM